MKTLTNAVSAISLNNGGFMKDVLINTIVSHFNPGCYPKHKEYTLIADHGQGNVITKEVHIHYSTSYCMVMLHHYHVCVCDVGTSHEDKVWEEVGSKDDVRRAVTEGLNGWG